MIPAVAGSSWRTSQTVCAQSERMPGLFGQALMRAAVALPPVAAKA